MPTIQVEKNNGRRVLIVGGGESARQMEWKHVQKAISKHQRGVCDVALINGVANGRAPTFAVGDTPTILRTYQDAGLHKKCHVVMNAPHKVAGPAEIKRDLGELVTSERTLFAPDTWQPMPSESLAVWAMAALGYAGIYLFGYDGTAQKLKGNIEFNHHRSRENMICRFLRARQRSVFAGEPSSANPKLIRVWPLMRVVKGRDPLEGVLAETIRVEPPANRKEKT